MFEMKQPRFFSQIDGSTRNTPNALGVIDSTVSSRRHQLYKLYQTYQNGKDPTLYFSYRYSEKAIAKDYWHPKMTDAQLNAYRERFMMGEFDKYFKNTWSSGAEKVFTRELIEATNYFGIDKQLNVHPSLIELITKKFRIFDAEKKIKMRNRDPEIEEAIHGMQIREHHTAD